MKQTIPCIDYNQTQRNLLVDPRLKICIECGHEKVERYEFGISCENCGVLHVFDPQKTPQKYLVVQI